MLFFLKPNESFWGQTFLLSRETSASQNLSLKPNTLKKKLITSECHSHRFAFLFLLNAQTSLSFNHLLSLLVLQTNVLSIWKVSTLDISVLSSAMNCFKSSPVVVIECVGLCQHLYALKHFMCFTCSTAFITQRPLFSLYRQIWVSLSLSPCAGLLRLLFKASLFFHV